MVFKFRPFAIFVTLIIFLFILLFFNIIGIFSKLSYGNFYGYSLIQLFYFNAENNIPTLFSSVMLLTSAAILSLISIKHRSVGSRYAHWLGLAFIFVFLSIDETAQLHEKLTEPVRDTLNTSGFLYYAWIIPYAAISGTIAIVYIRFLTRIPRRTSLLIILSGTTFIIGAIGFELLGGWYHELHGRANVIYSVFFTCEEFFEMLGVIVFVYTLLDYTVRQFKVFTVTVENPQ